MNEFLLSEHKLDISLNKLIHGTGAAQSILSVSFDAQQGLNKIRIKFRILITNECSGIQAFICDLEKYLTESSRCTRLARTVCKVKDRDLFLSFFFPH